MNELDICIDQQLRLLPLLLSLMLSATFFTEVFCYSFPHLAPLIIIRAFLMYCSPNLSIPEQESALNIQGKL